MNQVARVFVVVNLLLSAGFLLAAATFLQQNDEWKSKHDTARADMAREIGVRDQRINEKDDEIRRQTEAMNRLKDEKSRTEQEVTDLKARLEGEQQAKHAAEQNGQQLRGDVTKMTGELGELRTNVGSLEALIERYRDRQEQAEKAAAQAEVDKTAAVKESEDRQAKIHDLEKMIEDTKAVLAATSEKLNTYVTAYPPPVNLDQPKIDGYVTRWDAGAGLAEINRGKNNGVVLGHEFDIVRGTDYVCTVIVTSVGDAVCVCSVKIKTGREPAAGDLATKLTSAIRN